MSKLQDIRNLVQEHAVLVSSSPGDWMDYMDTASRLYRYSFSDQLLIHAQRPDATACASLELWNEKMLRWVNRGARGIALFDETWQNTKLRYVFDISDTHMVAGGRSPYLWKMQEHQREEILTHLAEVYALEEKDAATLQDALMAVAREMVNDNLEEYLDGLEYAVEGTYLEDLDEVTIRSDFVSWQQTVFTICFPGDAGLTRWNFWKKRTSCISQIITVCQFSPSLEMRQASSVRVF